MRSKSSHIRSGWRNLVAAFRAWSDEVEALRVYSIAAVYSCPCLGSILVASVQISIEAGGKIGTSNYESIDSVSVELREV